MRKLNDKMRKLLEEHSNRAMSWAFLNKSRIFLFILVSLFISLVSLLPYVNLFLTKHLVAYLIFISLFAIFKIGWREILYIVFLLFLVIFILTLWEEGETASMVGDYIYGFLVVALINYFGDI